MALELERRGIEHPGLAGRDLAVVLNGVEVEAGADPLVAMIEPRPAGADHLERAAAVVSRLRRRTWRWPKRTSPRARFKRALRSALASTSPLRSCSRRRRESIGS